jgi:N-hydroxyarylamine O-acetyltransferase
MARGAAGPLIDAYLRRLGYGGETRPTLSTLDALCLAHVKAIPFENLDVLLGRGIELSDEALDRKLLDGGRGGYCFEQNTLFLRVLTALGYRVRPCSARVRLQRPRDFTPARTHLFLEVDLEGARWLADVGVGALSPTCALRLDTEAEQPTPHEPRRIVREGALLFHQARLGEGWVDVCEFTLEEMFPIDREVASWFTSTHPQSHFRHRLVAARALDGGGRVTLLNRELTIRGGQGAATRLLETPAELLAVLAEHFSLHFPPGTQFHCAGLDWPAPVSAHSGSTQQEGRIP